jgi:organic radical activating enzyme
MSSFSLVVTEKCNWDCDYCYFPHLKNQKGPSLETFERHLPYIKTIMDKLDSHGLLVNIDIQGGEVGTMPLEILQYLFQTLQHKISVSTNGLFLEKEYHLDDKIRPYIGGIMWHVTDDFKSTVVDYNDDDIFISRGIVHNDMNEMIEFIKTNSHILFDYVEFEFDIKQRRTINFLLYHELLNEISHLDNVSDNAKEILGRRLSESKSHRDNCKRYNGSILIDLVNENICLCQRQLGVSIPLNEENLIHRLKTFPKDIFTEDTCDTCTRLYSGKFYGNVIERAMLIRSKL